MDGGGGLGVDVAEAGEVGGVEDGAEGASGGAGDGDEGLGALVGAALGVEDGLGGAEEVLGVEEDVGVAPGEGGVEEGDVVELAQGGGLGAGGQVIEMAGGDGGEAECGDVVVQALDDVGAAVLYGLGTGRGGASADGAGRGGVVGGEGGSMTQVLAVAVFRHLHEEVVAARGGMPSVPVQLLEALMGIVGDEAAQVFLATCLLLVHRPHGPLRPCSLSLGGLYLPGLGGGSAQGEGEEEGKEGMEGHHIIPKEKVGDYSPRSLWTKVSAAVFPTPSSSSPTSMSLKILVSAARLSQATATVTSIRPSCLRT